MHILKAGQFLFFLDDSDTGIKYKFIKRKEFFVSFVGKQMK